MNISKVWTSESGKKLIQARPIKSLGLKLALSLNHSHEIIFIQ